MGEEVGPNGIARRTGRSAGLASPRAAQPSVARRGGARFSAGSTWSAPASRTGRPAQWPPDSGPVTDIAVGGDRLGPHACRRSAVTASPASTPVHHGSVRCRRTRGRNPPSGVAVRPGPGNDTSRIGEGQHLLPARIARAVAGGPAAARSELGPARRRDRRMCWSPRSRHRACSPPHPQWRSRSKDTSNGLNPSFNRCRSATRSVSLRCDRSRSSPTCHSVGRRWGALMPRVRRYRSHRDRQLCSAPRRPRRFGGRYGA